MTSLIQTALTPPASPPAPLLSNSKNGHHASHKPHAKKENLFFSVLHFTYKVFSLSKKKKKKIYGREKQHIVHVKKKVAVKAIIA